MDELHTVRELFAEPPPPSARVVVQARRRATGARRRLPRARWALPGAGLVAAATALTLVAVTANPGSPRPGGSRSTSLSARQILLTAAASSAYLRDEPGKYWYTEFRKGNRFVISGSTIIHARVTTGDPYVVEERTATRDWTDAHSPHRTDAETKAGRGGTTPHYWGERDLGMRPVRPTDAKAWKRAGSPSVFTLPNHDGSRSRVSAGAAPWHVYKERTAFDSAFADGSIRQVRHLPADPAKLRRYLLSHPDANGRNRQDWQSDAQYLFDAGTYMLEFEPIPAGVREAVYRMLADVPQVRAVGKVRDPLGRSGEAVALGGYGVAPYRFENRLIVDPSTGRLLAVETVSRGRGPLPPGMMDRWQALVTATWTDKPPAHATTPPG